MTCLPKKIHPEKAVAVANEFVRLGVANTQLLTQMKLQKMIFIAHGWCLALLGRPLIADLFYAWPCGPVVPSVYEKFKMFGVMKIWQEAEDLYTDENETPVWIAARVRDITGEVDKLISKVWDVYGKFSGSQLSLMMHANGSPWRTVSENEKNDSNIMIPDELIQKYFKSVISSFGANSDI